MGATWGAKIRTCANEPSFLQPSNREEIIMNGLMVDEKGNTTLTRRT